MSVLQMPVPRDDAQPKAATPGITLTYTLLDMSGIEMGTASKPAYLRIALCGYGATLPCIPGTCMIGAVATWPGDIPYLGTPGSIKLWGNDVISPLGTYYSIAVLDTNKNVIQSGIYQFIGTQTLDLSNLQPVSTQPNGGLTEYNVVTGADGTQITLPSTPSPGTVVLVYRSGLKLSTTAGDYTIAANVITFTRGYYAGEVISVVYQPTPQAGTWNEWTQIASSTGTSLTLPFEYYPLTPLLVWRNGMKFAPNIDFTISANVITFVRPYMAGDVIDVFYTTGSF